MTATYEFFNQAERVAKRYNCATCFGHLVVFNRNGRFEVICARKVDGRCSGDGLVTQQFVERMRSQSITDLSEARHNLTSVLNLRRRTSAEQAAKELMGGE